MGKINNYSHFMEYYLIPQVAKVAVQASEKVIETVCKPNCDSVPEYKFCQAAQQQFDKCFACMMENKSRVN